MSAVVKVEEDLETLITFAEAKTIEARLIEANELNVKYETLRVDYEKDVAEVCRQRDAVRGELADHKLKFNSVCRLYTRLLAVNDFPAG